MKTYRSPRWALAIHVFVSSVMALIGVNIAVHPGNAGHPGTAPGFIAVGCALATGFIFLLIRQLNARLVVTEHGLTWHSMARTRNVSWIDIRDVLTVPSPAIGAWYNPAIKTGDKLIRIDSVSGPRRYTERIVTALRDSRLEVAAGSG